MSCQSHRTCSFFKKNISEELQLIIYCKMSLSKFPLLALPETVQPILVKYLGLHDKLALRGTCKATKEWVRKVPFGSTSTDPFPITSFSSYLQSGGLPYASYYYINNDNTGAWIFEDPSVPNFLETFGQNVRKLKVKKFLSCISDPELAFYERLPNLEELELEYIYDNNSSRSFVSRIPESFRGLTSLQIHCIDVADIVMGYSYVWKLLKHCELLETLLFPVCRRDVPGVTCHRDGKLGPLMDIVRARADTQNPVKFLDIRNYIDESRNMFGFDFVHLLDLCTSKNVKLNVDCSLFSLPDAMIRIEAPMDCIYSLQDLSEAVTNLDLSGLREVSIKSTSNCFQDESSIDWVNGDSTWPNLEKFNIHFDTVSNGGLSNLGEVMGFMLTDFERENVEEIRVSFERGVEGRTLTNPRKSLPYLAGSIQENYMNVRRLTIISWDTLNKDFIKLWESLDLLEEVHIEDCRKVGNVDFIGRDESNPVFLRLKGLRKLTLAKLDQMPKITDRVFRDVFKHMNLEEFRLQSDHPVKKITPAGILELANSPTFTRSLKKFPFKNWSMDGVDDASFRKLRSMFSCN